MLYLTGYQTYLFYQHILKSYCSRLVGSCYETGILPQPCDCLLIRSTSAQLTAHLKQIYLSRYLSQAGLACFNPVCHPINIFPDQRTKEEEQQKDEQQYDMPDKT